MERRSTFSPEVKIHALKRASEDGLRTKRCEELGMSDASSDAGATSIIRWVMKPPGLSVER